MAEETARPVSCRDGPRGPPTLVSLSCADLVPVLLETSRLADVHGGQAQLSPNATFMELGERLSCHTGCFGGGRGEAAERG